MKEKIKYKLTLAAVFLVGVAVAGAYFTFAPLGSENKTVSVSPDSLFGWKYPVAKFPSTGLTVRLAYSDIRDPGGLPQGLPVRLKIPVIAVDTAIEDALITSDGRMDVPAGSVNVAWFSLGPPPGETGSAVIGGHYGISDGKPFVFYNLDKLKIGDKIYIVDDKNATLAFIVRAIKSFDRDADATAVFTSDDGLAHLNLITCEGVWNKVNDTYPQRLVVFTDAIPFEGAAPPASVTPVKSVAAPQSGGSVPVPAPLNLGVPDVDIVLPPAATPVLPTTTVDILQPTMAPASQTFMQAVKNLYATPLDGLITFCLILAILFIFFKIIKR